MSRIEVDKIQQQCGTTLTVGGGACKTAVVDATTVTLGRCGGTVSLASGATQSGFGRTGTVDWQTGDIKTSNFTAANGKGYFCNTTGGGFIVDLPAGTAGDIVSVKDYLGTFDTQSLTIAPNGSEKIGGLAGNVTLTTEGMSLTLIYVNATQGWMDVQDSTANSTGASFVEATVSGACNTILTDGNYKIAKFVNPGTFCVSAISTSTPAYNDADYVIVGGGASGAGGDNGVRGGGGGAGGYRESPGTATCYTASPRGAAPATAVTLAVQPYPIDVGGGAAAPGPNSPINNPVGAGANGSNSSFNSIVGAGGGGGTTYCGGATKDGGSGGGGGSSPNGPERAGGSGNQPPTNPVQGRNGGLGVPYAGAPLNSSGGGGGGAACEGQDASGSCGGDGGSGVTTQIIGSPVTYAGGGGGGGDGGQGGSGGAGGGGAGGESSPATGNSAGCAGTQSTGGGGGGGSSRMNPAPSNPNVPGSQGGSGIVYIRYRFQ